MYGNRKGVKSFVIAFLFDSFRKHCPPPVFNKGKESFEDGYTKCEFGCYVKEILGICSKEDTRKCSKFFKPQSYPVLQYDNEHSCFMQSCLWNDQDYENIGGCSAALKELCPAPQY